MSTRTAPSKSPIWKNKWAWLVAALVVLGIIITIGTLTEEPDSAPDAAGTPAAEDLSAVPDVAGMPADEARDAISDAGFIARLDGGEEVVVNASNWDAVDTTPAAGAEIKAGETVTINVVRAEERLAEEREATQRAAEERANGPIGATEAQGFCSLYAEEQLPYGVDMHWIMGKLAEEETENGWFLKVEADVTNEYGAEQSGMNIECHVSGTNNAPVMDEFLVY